MTFLIDFLAFLIAFGSYMIASGHPSYREYVPNGYKIKDPCNGKKVWQGAGHLIASGGGRLNPFGEDFLKERKRWTRKLCLKDSDGDGKTNGQELGDPYCKWKRGKAPLWSSNISHPGICEPIESKRCIDQKSWFSCRGKDHCPAKNEAQTRYFDAVFPASIVPAQETSYYCKTFALPDDKDYHVVATEPVISNPLVVHHMDLYACPELDHLPFEYKPFECMMGAQCSEMIAGWALGEPGFCTSNVSGIRFGRTGFKYIRLQIHWNNQRKIPNTYDSSGLRLFYTERLRKHDMGQLISAQLYLRIPPKKKTVKTHPAICSGECTKSFLPHPIHVISVNLHMHFAGKSISLKQYRNGKKVRDLARDRSFDYNNPDHFYFNPPLLVMPGDELRTQCTYHSEDRESMTYDGYGALQEMCFAFIYYYPKVQRSGLKCASIERHSYCEIDEMNDYSFLYKHNYGICNLTAFDKAGYIRNVFQSCGYYPEYCSRACKRNVDAMFSHDCLQGILGQQLHEAQIDKNIMIASSVWQARRTCRNAKFPEKASGIKQNICSYKILTIVLMIIFTFQ